MRHTDYYASSPSFNPEVMSFVDWFDMQSTSVMVSYREEGMQGHTHCYIPYIPKDGDGNAIPSHKQQCLDLLKKEGYGEFDGHCQHCGAQLRYCCIFRNGENGELIVVGETCAETRMGLTLDSFKIDRAKEAAAALETRRWRQEQISQWIGDSPDREELISWIAGQGGEFFYSLIHYFNRWGRLTEGQEAAARRSREKEAEKAARMAQQKANSEPAPEGRAEVTGTVVNIKVQLSYYGGRETATPKMLVDCGSYRVWSTIPSDIYLDDWSSGENVPGVKVGDKVTFTATLQQSDDDPSFAFAKRPTKSSIIR